MISFWKNVLLYSNLIVASGIALSYYSTCLLFGIQSSREMAFFLFFAVASLYNLHWMLLPPHNLLSNRELWIKKYQKIFLILLIICSGLTIYFSLFFSLNDIIYLLPPIGSSILYLSPKLPFSFFDFFRKHIRMKTTMLAFTWTYTADIMPVLHCQMPLHANHLFYWIYRYGLIYAICILFDYRDRHMDQKKGIRSFLYHLNVKQIKQIVLMLLVLSCLGNVLLIPIFAWYIVLLQLLPWIILQSTISFSIQSQSDTWYLLVLDNLLFLVPWILVLLQCLI